MSASLADYRIELNKILLYNLIISNYITVFHPPSLGLDSPKWKIFPSRDWVMANG
ncbi:hypothetical protein H6G35_30165 [Aulosira sp. FACHB-113]|nr:hypothetical protein [Aulosira sp. FACHB-113]